jgi:hypothetical protein
MAIKYIKAVGENPHFTASEKSVLMCLGWRANADGFCYPGVESIAQWTGLSHNTVRTSLKKVEGYGCLRREERRGRSTYYFLNLAIIEGYAPTSSGGGTPPQNTTPTKTDTPTNSKTDTLPKISQTPLPNPGDRKVNERSVDKSNSGLSSSEERPSVGPSNAAKPERPGTKRVTEVMKALQDRRGYPSLRYKAEAREIKNILTAGYTPDEILGCYDWLKSQTFWAGRPVQARHITNNIGEFRTGGPARASPKVRATRADIQTDWTKYSFAGE